MNGKIGENVFEEFPDETAWKAVFRGRQLVGKRKRQESDINSETEQSFFLATMQEGKLHVKRTFNDLVWWHHDQPNFDEIRDVLFCQKIVENVMGFGRQENDKENVNDQDPIDKM
eukprot:Trichotokara_eunicae@DN1178_c0_g1_i1.p1